MDFSHLDYGPGKSFSAKVRSSLHCSITSPPGSISSFWLLASFPRSKFHLDISSVGILLQSIIGGSLTCLNVVELDHCIFKFKVASVIYSSCTSPAETNSTVQGAKENAIYSSPPLECSRRQSMEYRFQRANPHPFMLPGFNPHWVSNHERMVCAVVPWRRPLHEYWDIITIEPMLEFEVLFHAIEVILREFFVDHMRLEIMDIQPSHLGQALEDIDQAIGYFARLISWEHDVKHKYHLILKASVVDLASVPEFIVSTDGDEFHGQSWTIQCEILQHTMIGVLLADEDPKPNDHPLNDNNPPIHDFFGFGQPGQDPPNHWQEVEIQPPPNPIPDIWLVWNAANNNKAPNGMPDLNLAPDQDDNMVEVVQKVEENFIHNAVNFSDSSSLPGSNSSVNMDNNEEIPAIDLNLVLGLPIQQQYGAFLHEEIVEEDLWPNNFQEEDLENNQPNNIQIGMVRVQGNFSIDPGYNAFSQRKPTVETFRIWTKHFDNKLPSIPKTSIPLEGADFFTSLLSSPTHLKWAKKFLASKAWECVTSSLYNSNSLRFSLPSERPHIQIACDNPDENIKTPQEASPRKRRKIFATKVILVEDDKVKRSERLKDLARGFKKQTCIGKYCLAFSADRPPTVSPSVFKSLGATTFCQMDAKELSDEVLNAKKRTTKKAIKKSTKPQDNDPATSTQSTKGYNCNNSTLIRYS
uniref:Uncharacterized protein n=1 Tax=Setaria viridis TaxID=4556 RepID=A0A4U6W8B3_SETVI|nr:hypothetical protein SEVIR_1G134300v2 [Setaria viridis]